MTAHRAEMGRYVVSEDIIMSTREERDSGIQNRGGNKLNENISRSLNSMRVPRASSRPAR